MGLVASSALENGGEVHGIIPKAFLVAANGEKGEGGNEEEIGKGKTVNLEGERSTVTVVGGMHEVRRDFLLSFALSWRIYLGENGWEVKRVELTHHVRFPRPAFFSLHFGT